MVFQSVDDAVVSLDLISPGTLLGVGAKLADVGELLAHDRWCSAVGTKLSQVSQMLA